MADKTVRFRPYKPAEFTVVGSDADRGVLLSIEEHDGRYEEGIARLLRRTLPRDGVAVDVGANIGVLSVLMASLCNRGRVYAFEPAKENFAYLARNVAAFPNVSTLPLALLDGDRDVGLAYNDAYPAGSHVSESAQSTVAARTLDSWAREEKLDRLDVLKIDVEGAEPAVLRGAAQTIERFSPLTVVECNVQALRRVSDVSFAQFFKQFRAMFGRVALVEPTGKTTRLASADDLELALGHHGVVDMVGLASASNVEGLVDWVGSMRRLLSLRRQHTADSPPRDRNFVVSPRVRFEVEAGNVRGARGSTVEVPVTVVNDSRWWLSSAFTYEPVHLSYRVLDASGTPEVAEGHRTSFPSPVGPGQRTTLPMLVELPAARGTHTLVVTLVQEAFAWLDELDPSCATKVELVVY